MMLCADCIKLCTMGAYSAMPIVICWFQQNLAGHHRRAIGTGWQIGFGNIGGIIATYVFLDRDKPKFTRGYGTCLGFICLAALSCLLYAAACIMENRKREKMPKIVGRDKETEEAEKGDLAQNYRYLL